MHRPNELRIPRIVTDCPADLRDQAVKSDLGDERLRPQARVDIVLRHGVRAPFDQKRKQVERLARQAEVASALRDNPACGVERQILKRECHAGAKYRPWRKATQIAAYRFELDAPLAEPSR
jgi:hypothetical protein